MTSIRILKATDLFHVSNINLDKYTENYQISFYLHYLAKWPEMNYIATSQKNIHMGYLIGKAEGSGKDWHGHVSAVTVSTEHRRLGIAERLMFLFEAASERCNGYFVDLFVRESNKVAIRMYQKLGYIVYRRVLDYYSGDNNGNMEEDALDMRKSLSMDPKKLSMIPCTRPVTCDEIIYD